MGAVISLNRRALLRLEIATDGDIDLGTAASPGPALLAHVLPALALALALALAMHLGLALPGTLGLFDQRMGRAKGKRRSP